MKIQLYSAALIMMGMCALPGCQSEHNHNHERDDTTQASDHNHGESSNGLTLNKGAQWNSDSATNSNVTAIQKIASSEKPSTLEDYHNAGEKIQSAIQNLINGCRMQGEDHNALHHWLQPLLEMNDELTSSQTTEQASEIFNKERQQIDLYFQYFEYKP